MSFFAELKRRNVIRMAGLYLVGAWLLVQIGETLLPIFHTPDWVLQTLVVLLAMGFIPALVFSWIFELTSDGLKRDGEVTPAQSIAPQTAQRMNRLILAGMVAVVGVVAADRFWPQEETTALMPTEAAADAVTPKSVPEVPKPVAGTTGGGQLVAVLPFRNRSARAEDAFFAEGIHDDLLTQLSKLAGLKVISRTSMMRYADSVKSIPEIAAELGAAVVLEGAVQRAGDQVRVNVQLIDGASDVHLWAENYDRELTTETIFAIQADIAQAVAAAMQVALSPEASNALRTGSTQNLQAYEAYLRGKLLSGTAQISDERSRQAIAEFDRAIALDPAFAEAYARKAKIQLVSYWIAIGPHSLRDEARASIAKAKRLAPDSIETLFAEAQQHYYAELDYAAADRSLKKILAQAPDHAEAWETSGYIARRDGRFDDSIAAFERALAIDPQAVDVMQALMEVYGLARGDFDRAAALLQRSGQLGADTGVREIWLQRWRGDIEAAWAAIDGPVKSYVTTPIEVAMATRKSERIAYALSPAMWPEDQRGPGDFPETYAMYRAEALLVLGQQAEADRLLAGIKARMAQSSDPYPSRWLGNAYYQPCDLPGMLGDPEGVHAAEADFLANAPRDVWGSRGSHFPLSEALARVGDLERSLHYLEMIVGNYGPQTFLQFASWPGLDPVRGHPRYRALELRYQAWAKEHGHE